MVRVGLVTVLYKSEEVLEGFFRSISRQSFKDYHLLLVDNSPGPQTALLIRELSVKYPLPGFTHIENATNTGVAAGNNLGIRRSMEMRCTHTLLLNNDIEFDQPFLLEEMITHATQHHEFLVVPKIFYFGTRKIWMAGGWLLKRRGIVLHIGDGVEDSPRFDQPAYFDYAPTCFMLIDHEVFEKVGMMDEQYFVYYDDTDSVFRATLRGYRVYYMPSLHVFHKVSSSIGGGESVVSIYYNTRNRIYFLRKNFSVWQQLIPMVYTLVTRLIRYFLYNRNQRAKLAAAIRDGFTMKPDRK
jgi:GT2 family glycosyltransferase